MFVIPIDGALSEYINHLHRSSGAVLDQLPTKAVLAQLSTDAHHNGILVVRDYFTGILG